MEKYKAQKNNKDGAKNVAQKAMENKNDKAPKDNELDNAEAPQKTQDQIDAENNENTLRNVAEVAEASGNPYAVAAAKAFKAADKISGGKTTQALGKGMAKANKMAPGGQMVQNASNKLSESGAGDKIGKAAAAKNGSSSGGAAKSSSSSTSTSSSSGISSSSGSGSNSSSKAPLLIGAGALGLILPLMLFLTVFAEQDEVNMQATNNSSMSNPQEGMRACTQEEIKEKLLYVGDSRMVGMQNALNDDKVNFVAEGGQGYTWFMSTALSQIESKLQENSDLIVVLALGINDLSNCEKYIDAYNDLIKNYPDRNIYVLSVNPVDEAKASAVGYPLLNSDIEEFNMKLRSNLGSRYIDSYSTLNITTSDGIHYDSSTYVELHDIIISKISSGGKVMCSNGGGDFTTCALTLKDGVYYKTMVPQTNDCQAGAFTETIGLEPNFYANLMALIADANTIGCNAVINSGRRTLADQARLYRMYSNQPGRAAPPGYSNHEFGIAVDLAYIPRTSNCISYYHNTAPNYGLHFPLVNATVPEDWHIEPINIQRGSPE